MTIFLDNFIKMSSNTEKFTPVTNDSITYDINSNRQVGQITHLSHHAPLSPFQARIERFVEKYGGETIGVQRLAEEDRDVSQKPISKLEIEGLDLPSKSNDIATKNPALLP